MKYLYINLPESVDRRAAMEEQLCGLDYERVEATRKPHGYHGAGISHLEALRHLREHDTVCILEDDFQFIGEPAEVEAAVQRLQAADPEWDVLMLNACFEFERWGDAAFRTRQGDAAGCVRCRHATDASGYVVRRKALDKLETVLQSNIETWEAKGGKGCHCFDWDWHAVQDDSRWYAAAPPLGRQVGNSVINPGECFSRPCEWSVQALDGLSPPSPKL